MTEELVGLIPAAGKGVRLNLPYPKELYPIIRDNKYKPVAQFVLENLLLADVKHVVFVVNETKHQLIGYFGSGRRFGAEISYAVQEERQDNNGGAASPGLADALDSAYHLVKGKTVYFGMPDTLMEPPEVFAHLRGAAEEDDDVVLGLFAVSRPEKFGMVQMNGDRTVEAVIDKPRKTNLTHAWGCIVWGPRFTDHLHRSVSDLGIGDFAEILNSGIREGFRVRGVALPGGSYKDLGTFEEILELDQLYRAGTDLKEER